MSGARCGLVLSTSLTPACGPSDLDEPVGELVAGERAGRKMLRQHGAALLDRGNEAFGGAAVFHLHDERRDGTVPDGGIYLGVDAAVRHDLRIALGKGCEDQNA